MTTLQDTNTATAPLDRTQINESEEKVWHQPTLTTWKAPEVTLKLCGSGTPDPC